jgi:hypothetical protein
MVGVMSPLFSWPVMICLHFILRLHRFDVGDLVCDLIVIQTDCFAQCTPDWVDAFYQGAYSSCI